MKKISKLLTSGALLMSSIGWGQCISPNSFGSSTANACTPTTTITTCAYGGEYSTVTFNVTGPYSFDAAGGSGNYLTLTDLSNNPLAFGTPPINYTISTPGDYRLHVSTSAACGAESACHTLMYTCLNACNPVTGLISAGTTSVSTNLSWTSPATGFDIYYGLSPLSAPNATTVPTGTTNVNSYTPTGLNASTVYDAYIRTNCGATQSTWSLITFTTGCSGIPSGGLTEASIRLLCNPQNVNFYVTGSTMAADLNYQWQSSPNGSIWTSIPSATLSTITQSVTADTYYQLIIGCGTNTIASTPVQITIAPTTTNAIAYSEGFEGITMNNELPNCSWAASNLSGVCQTYSTSPGSFNRIPNTGNAFASFRYGTNASGDYFYSNGIQLTAGVNYQVSADYITDGANGWTEFSLLYGSTQSTGGLVTAASISGNLTNTSYQNLAGTFSVSTSGIYYVAVKAIGNFNPWYLTFDDLTVDIAPTCTAVPVAGTISGPSTVNNGTTNSYTISPATGNIQWYSGASATGPWLPINGATFASNQAITATGSGTVYYTSVASNPGCINDTANVAYLVNVNFPGDNVCDAIPLSLGTSTVQYTLNGATTQVGEVIPPNTGFQTNTGWGNINLSNSRWFSFVAPASGYVTVQSPDFDSQLAIWKANACADLLSSTTATLIAANDDDADYNANGGVIFSSFVKAACLTPGLTYYIQMDSYDTPAQPNASSRVLVTDMGAPLNTSFTGLATNYCLPVNNTTPFTPVVSGGEFTINTNTTSVTFFSASTAGSYTVSYSLYGCKNNSITTVASSPTVAAVNTNTIAICSGASATLTASGATNYTWSPVGGTTSTAVVSPTTNATYTVTGETAGCSSIATIIVSVNNPSVSVVASSSAICLGASATFTASGATNYTWSPAGGTADIAIVSPSSSSIYTVTGEIGGCSNTNTVSLTVNTTPTVIVTASSSTICAGSSATLTASGATNYTWTPVGGTSVTAIVSPTANATYTVVGTNACGTNSTTTTVDITIPLTISAAQSASLICAGETATLTASGTASSFTWTPGGQTTPVIAVTPTTTTIYTVTSSNLCGVVTATVAQNVSACAGVQELESVGISVYPNPSNGNVNFDITSELAGNVSLEMYDTIGKLVAKENLTKEHTVLNISKLEEGIYIFKLIRNNGDVKIGRIIKL